MTFESFITSYGYAALFAGVLLEGETVVIVSGLLAYQGDLRLSLVILIACTGAFLVDQAMFQLGRHKGQAIIERRPQWRSRIESVRRFLVRYHIVAIIGYRFIYGMRTVAPLLIGTSGFSTRRFMILNMISTFIWASVVACAGYFFGSVIRLFLEDVHRYQWIIVLVILLPAGMIWFYRYRIRKQ
ncbi:DedA family protein [Geobacter sp. DSM 9736]|uniref:DedA family protein n=1 Tax=Geobacter sp. DSM 9736 TaxID=1277350 RepID=UPI000B61D88B|nr:DedA family protein [Geobacter sp. DSM 9736]SNB45870.1 membrane protein DedA, SNARE-associated domain [Geobacter sp. DSM 9736]